MGFCATGTPDRPISGFESEVANKPYYWAEKARQELNAHLKAIGTTSLRNRLAKIKTEKLRALKLPPQLHL
jgi:hypothetical protein